MQQSNRSSRRSKAVDGLSPHDFDQASLGIVLSARVHLQTSILAGSRREIKAHTRSQRARTNLLVEH